MRFNQIVYLFFILFVFSFKSNADEVPVTETKIEKQTEKAADNSGKWDGEFEFGLLTTKGNTDTESSHARLKVEYLLNKWVHLVKIESLQTEENGITTAERIAFSYQMKFKWSDKDYLFSLLKYEEDTFAGFEQRTTELLGYGRILFDSSTYKQDIELGVGARQTELTDLTESDKAVFRIGTNINWKYSDTTTFSEALFIEQGSDNTLTESTTELKVKINSHLALKVSLKIQHNSDVPVDKVRQDTTTAVTLVYDF